MQKPYAEGPKTYDIPNRYLKQKKHNKKPSLLVAGADSSLVLT